MAENKNDSDKTQKGTKPVKKNNAVISFLKDEKFKVSLGLITLFFSAYLLLALVSYFFTWRIDQSKLDISGNELFGSGEITVENWAGKTGAILANSLIHNLFGIAAFSVVFLLIIIGLRFLKVRLIPLRKSIKFSIVVTVWLSITLSFLFKDDYFVLGGMHGYLACEWINALIGKVGTAFVILISLFIFIIFTFNGALDWLKRIIKAIIMKVRPPADVSEKEGDVNGSQGSLTEEPLLEIYDEADVELDDESMEEAAVGSDVTNANNKVNLASTIPFEVSTPNDGPINKFDNHATDGLQFNVENKIDEEDDILDEIICGPDGDYDPTIELSNYIFPTLDLLEDHKASQKNVSREEWEKELTENKNKIVETLGHYKIEISRISAVIGPTVTLYEIVPAPGIRISKIKNLEDDIALSLAALGIRIIAPMPGKGTIGIEVPNMKPEVVSMRSVIASKAFQESDFDLPIVLGKTISNETFVVDLAKMPHLLVAGATGQGKSVGINAILTSLLYKKHPAQLKFVLIDPKKVELSVYSKIEKHFLAKLPEEKDAIITDTMKVVATMNSLCIEMDQRYDLLKVAGARNIKEYNSKFIKRRLNPEKGHRFLPFIVVIIDEFADLIMTAGKEIETPIARIAQLARAIGIHVIIATQRPSANIITGVIKANFPARLAFKVASSIDSRTILDSPGANQLIGKGDMLITKGSELVRIQCAFVDTPEVERIVDFIEEQQGYSSAYYLPEYVEEGGSNLGEVDMNQKDEMFEEAARLIVTHQQGSTSLLQRKFSIGYNRAGKIIDQLEVAGVVGPFQGSKARQVLITDLYALEQFLNNLNNQ